MQQSEIAVVTGGASGLGRALCEELARKGVLVVVTDIDGLGAERVSTDIRAHGGRAESAQLDVSYADHVGKLIDEVVSRHGKIDFIFNNAAIAIVGELRDGSINDFRRVVEVNLFGVIHGTMAAYRAMLRQRSGHIVNISSMTGLMATPILTAYSTTKWAIVGFTTALRKEAADLGVKVSVACPGLVRTNIPDRTIYWNVDKDEYLKWLPWQNTMLSPNAAAKGILRGVARNQEMIFCPSSARIAWWVHRLCPAVLSCLMGRTLNSFRKLRKN